MGWDAYSSAKYNYQEKKFRNPEHGRLFKNAFKYVKRKCGTVDCFLDHGGLDCSDCARMLERATGRSCWTYKGWSPKVVQELHKNANWNFEYSPDLAWAYWSARKFLEVCAKAGLSVRFSW